MMDDGYICWYRKAEKNEVLHDDVFDRTHAWLWIVEHACFATHTNYRGGRRKTYKRGQYITSVPKLAKQFGWSEGKVRRFLQDLKSAGMIRSRGNARGTTLTVENYDKYQLPRRTDNTTDSTTDGTTRGTTHGRQNNKRNKGTVADPRNRGPLPLEEVDPRYLDLPMGEPDKW